MSVKRTIAREIVEVEKETQLEERQYNDRALIDNDLLTFYSKTTKIGKYYDTPDMPLQRIQTITDKNGKPSKKEQTVGSIKVSIAVAPTETDEPAYIYITNAKGKTTTRTMSSWKLKEEESSLYGDTATSEVGYFKDGKYSFWLTFNHGTYRVSVTQFPDKENNLKTQPAD